MNVGMLVRNLLEKGSSTTLTKGNLHKIPKKFFLNVWLLEIKNIMIKDKATNYIL